MSGERQTWRRQLTNWESRWSHRQNLSSSAPPQTHNANHTHTHTHADWHTAAVTGQQPPTHDDKTRETGWGRRGRPVRDNHRLTLCVRHCSYITHLSIRKCISFIQASLIKMMGLCYSLSHHTEALSSSVNFDPAAAINRTYSQQEWKLSAYIIFSS